MYLIPRVRPYNIAFLTHDNTVKREPGTYSVCLSEAELISDVRLNIGKLVVNSSGTSTDRSSMNSLRGRNSYA